jgi:hypothetical protein
MSFDLHPTERLPSTRDLVEPDDLGDLLPEKVKSPGLEALMLRLERYLPVSIQN